MDKPRLKETKEGIVFIGMTAEEACEMWETYQLMPAQLCNCCGRQRVPHCVCDWCGCTNPSSYACAKGKHRFG